MGLKYVHLTFIAMAALCMLAFGLWALSSSQPVFGLWGRLGGAFSATLGLALAGYGTWFWRKSRKIIC